MTALGAFLAVGEVQGLGELDSLLGLDTDVRNLAFAFEGALKDSL